MIVELMAEVYKFWVGGERAKASRASSLEQATSSNGKCLENVRMPENFRLVVGEAVQQNCKK